MNEQTIEEANKVNDTKWLVFSDRAMSLLGRWDKFYVHHIGDEGLSEACIKGFLSEINDEFTKGMLSDKENFRAVGKDKDGNLTLCGCTISKESKLYCYECDGNNLFKGKEKCNECSKRIYYLKLNGGQ